MKRVGAVILAGGKSEDLQVLTRHRATAALPFGGRYRVIDFPLSSLVHSDITSISVLTQYAPVSLNNHIEIGRPWDLDRRDGGIRLLQPYVRKDGTRWYAGTADALYQNIDVITDDRYRDVLVISGDAVYTMDFGPIVEFHRDRGARITLVVRPFPKKYLRNFGVVDVDPGGGVVDFMEKPKAPRTDLASLGIYVFDPLYLREHLSTSTVDLVHDVILPAVQREDRVVAYRFDGFWRDVGRAQGYYQANRALLDKLPELNLYDPYWRILTKSEERAPVRLLSNAVIKQSIVANGAVVAGEVVNSILFPGVRVSEGACVVDSIVMPETVIHEGAKVFRAIIDKDVSVGAGARVGDPGATLDQNGLVQIGKGIHIPDGTHIAAGETVDAGAYGWSGPPGGRRITDALGGVAGDLHAK